MLKDINPADLCPECKVIRSARSRHCAICHQCVERFDHHCPWINNCVGIKNHNAFMLFLFTIWFKILFHIWIVIESAFKFLEKDGQYECEKDECVFVCFFGLCKNPYVHIAASAVCLVICIFYFLMSTLMIVTHVQNYMANRTTNERFSRRRRAPSDANSSMTSSVMSLSDFESAGLTDSNNDEELLRSKAPKKKRRGCLVNCWKMSTHTKVVP